MLPIPPTTFLTVLQSCSKEVRGPLTLGSSQLPRLTVLSYFSSGSIDGLATLVRDFDLRSGAVDVTVPSDILAGTYTIIRKYILLDSERFCSLDWPRPTTLVFGDSGNVSPPFEIVA